MRQETYQVYRYLAGGKAPESGGRFTSDNGRNFRQEAVDYARLVFKTFKGQYRVTVERVETETIYDSGEPYAQPRDVVANLGVATLMELGYTEEQARSTVRAVLGEAGAS